ISFTRRAPPRCPAISLPFPTASSKDRIGRVSPTRSAKGRPKVNGGAAMSDELPTATRVSDPGIRALYRLENRWQAWLDVEAALARAQAELGIIPAAAAEAIAAKARLELMDRKRIDEGFARTGHTLVPLVWELGRIVGEPH